MSAYRIKGADGVIIDSDHFLELPKAATKTTTFAERAGMIRYNSELKAFEGVLEFDDSTVQYRRFASLDANGQLSTSQLPDSITSGMRYIGTYSPISDDIDPPVVDGEYDSLPAATTANAGQYFIVRGISDEAQLHYSTNLPTTSPVTFTPVNPSAEGNWLEIKYYFGSDPVDNTKNIVIAAFGRIIIANIPGTGHDGLLSLSTDVNLTTFSSTDDRSQELALTDSDWVISDGVKQQRNKQNRISISASAVLFDRTLMTANNRSFKSTAGTVQTIIDNIINSGLRRTGDSMLDDGSIGEGRLGLVYGTATAPSVAFNSNVFDPVTNPGIDPSLWSDTSTGIFHPALGSIGLSASGTERFRISPTQMILYPVTSSTAAVPNVLFSATGNTNLGMNIKSNTIDFVSNSAVNVSLAQGLSTFNGNVVVTGNHTVNGNTILGDAGTDTLTVNAASTFAGTTLFNNATNRFALGAVFSSGSTLSFEGTTTATITKAATELRFNMGSFDDISIYDGATLRSKFNRYGIQLPVLSPVDNANGVDGMVAYSPDLVAVVQKSAGQWKPVGGGVVSTFTNASWVLNGANYTYTITSNNIQTVFVQELSGSNYSPVEVDSIVISATNAVLSVPASPDLRFTGRVIVQ